MGDDALQGVIETIDAAISYRLQLSQLLDNVHEAKNQVQSSAAQSRTKLRAHFDCLRQCVTEALDERLSVLERAVNEAETEALEPLNSCEQALRDRTDIAIRIMDRGKQLLVLEDEKQQSDGDIATMSDFKRNAKDLDVHSLPDVPSLAETAYIHVDLPRDEENVQRQLVDAVRDYGHVLTHVPVQIVDISERPAALVVKWAESEDHSATELEEFRLQFCPGAVRNADSTESPFIDAYVGPNTSFVVRQLVQGKPYTFRVSGRGDENTAWSPWSTPIVWSTSLTRHEWRASVPGYVMSDDRTTLIQDGGQAVVAYSQSSSYLCGHSITFHINNLDATASEVDDGVGLTLVDSNLGDDLLRSKGFIFYSFQGGVFVDGQEKTTRLPAISPGATSLSFETELLPSDKVRVTIEVSEKIITFDWPLSERSAPMNSNSAFGPGCSKADKDTVSFFFAARLSNKNCSITVE